MTEAENQLHSDFIAIRRMMWTLMLSLLMLFAGGSGTMFVIVSGQSKQMEQLHREQLEYISSVDNHHNERLVVLEHEANRGPRYTARDARDDKKEQAEFNQRVLTQFKAQEALVQQVALEVRDLSVQVKFMNKQISELKNSYGKTH